MSPDVDLYFKKMELDKYCPAESCEVCKVESFGDFVDKLKSGEVKSGSCPHWPAWRLEAFRLAVTASDYIPPVPMLDLPRPAEAGLIELIAGDDAPVLVTGNSEFTQAVMLAVLAMAAKPLKLLSVDCLGHTVDMAMIFKTLTADKISQAFTDHGVDASKARRVVLPGLTSILAPELEKLLGRPVEVGPICAAELPLYLGEDFAEA